MFKKLFSKKKEKDINSPESLLQEGEKQLQISKDINDSKSRLKQLFGDSSDFTIDQIIIGNRKGLLCYLTTMSELKSIHEKVTIPLANVHLEMNTFQSNDDWITFCKEVFTGSQQSTFEYEHEMVRYIMNGHVVILLEGMNVGLSLAIYPADKRSIEEPSTQTIIRGPKDGFVEDVFTNMSLVRRRIRNPALRFEQHVVGKETATSVYLAYMYGIANNKIIEEVRKRITDIETNAIFESANIEEFITDKTFTPFPLIYNTERADSICAHLISGKVAIFVDGTPFVLSMPSVLPDFISSPEDFYQPFYMGTALRLLRYISFLIALVLPALYVSIVTFHHEMIPTALLISIASQREHIPFPAVIEALLMEFTFEILREAGIRMPRAVGGTISIVGGLVIGQAAVEAGIVSNVMVIIVALTAISSFVAPVYSFAISTRLLRFLFIVVAGIFGMYGVFIGLIMMVCHLASLRSFSVPYLAPFAPFIVEDQSDVALRIPIWAMKKRPKLLRTEENIKQPNAESPSPPKKGEE